MEILQCSPNRGLSKDGPRCQTHAVFRPRIRLALCALAIAFAGVSVALACQVPVFRFALERWAPDPYQVMVSPGPSGEFSETEQQAIDFLKSQQPDRLRTDPTGVSANLEVEISEAPAEGAVASTLRVTYPERIRGYEMNPIWEGPLTMENAQRLVASPTRRELVKRLLSGESAVWLIVESGNAELDNAAEITIKEAIAEARDTLRVPDGVMTRQQAESAENFAAVNSDDILRSEVPLKIDFSVLRISRADSAEAMFLPMVLNIEDDLAQFEKEPMVFPVFGRGRLLEPLIGRGIHVDNVMEYGAYLCGACSCEVKEQNPGMDLLVAADWETALHGSEVVIDKVLPPLEGTGILAQAKAETETSIDNSSGNAAAATAPPSSGNSVEAFPPTVAVINWRILLLAGLMVVFVIVIGTLFILRKKSS